jgi:hypothetical protein
VCTGGHRFRPVRPAHPTCYPILAAAGQGLIGVDAPDAYPIGAGVLARHCAGSLTVRVDEVWFSHGAYQTWDEHLPAAALDPTFHPLTCTDAPLRAVKSAVPRWTGTALSNETRTGSTRPTWLGAWGGGAPPAG